MSDWGRHPIQRELFQEELTFIVNNLAQVRTLISLIHGERTR